MMSDEQPEKQLVSTKSPWQGWAPLLIIAALSGLVLAMGWHHYLSFKTIGLNYDALRAFIADNLLLAVLLYAGLYIAVIALSMPGGLIMTLAGGLLFGWQLGAPVTIIAATIGATIIFLIAKTSFGEALAAKAGPWIGKLRQGFQENALSYLLFLRLVPAFPFVVVNLAPALLGVPLSTYIVGTLIGIIPGTTAYSIAGAGLGSVVQSQNKIYAACLAEKGEGNCAYSIDFSALVTKELVFAGAALGVVALIPVVVNWYKKRGKNHAAA
jgi:uncharacterized membrane protein YdjX (TVP38/TMEM64 family)